MNIADSMARLVRRTLLLSMVLAPALAAQRDRDGHEDQGEAAARHAVKCRIAARVIASGVPREAQQEAHELIVSCASQAPAALAAETRRLGSSHDTASLQSVLTGALYVRDTGVFNAALDVAGRASATNEARAVGLLAAAIELTDRVDFDLSVLMTATTPMPCVDLVNDHSLRMSGGTPLDATAPARLKRLTRAVLAAASSPLLVSNAARCAETVTGR